MGIYTLNHIDKLKDKWNRGEVCIGTAVQLTDSTISELLGEAGYDFIWVDCEHSSLGLTDTLNHLRTARGAGTATFIRVPSNDPVIMKPYLDLHPAGIIVPRINNIEDAKQAIESFRYPPNGIRGFGPSRGARFGKISAPDYLEQVEQQMLLILQIEHIDAVNQIDAILDLPGVGSIVTGPADLSGSMGFMNEFGHPKVVEAIERVYKAAIRKGIPTGHPTSYDPQGLRKWIGLGLSWISVDGDWITLYQHAKRVADDIRQISSS